jgi:hypothetical protein
MHYKKWVKISLISTLLLLVVNAIFLYYTDIYGVGHPKRKIFSTAFHQRFFVVEYMKKHLKDYDTLLFGSSRVQFINPQHIPHANAYNLTVAEGIPQEYYLMLKYFLDHGAKPKLVLVGLDNFTFNISFAQHQEALETKSHYLITGENPAKFYSNFYFRKPTKRDFDDLKNKRKHLNLYKMHYDIIFHQKESFAHQTYTQPKPNAPIYNDPTTWHGNELDSSLKAIQKIKKLCDKNHIKCIFFINPIQHTSYDAMMKDKTNKELFSEFKKRLATISDYYDFSRPNAISRDNRNWLETSHFIPKIGDLILKTIFDDKVYVKDFGIHIKQVKEAN